MWVGLRARMASLAVISQQQFVTQPVISTVSTPAARSFPSSPPGDTVVSPAGAGPSAAVRPCCRPPALKAECRSFLITRSRDTSTRSSWKIGPSMPWAAVIGS